MRVLGVVGHLISPWTIVDRGSLGYPTAPTHGPRPAISIPNGEREAIRSAGNFIPAGGQLQY